MPSSSYGSTAWANADGKALAGGMKGLPFLANHYNGYATGISADGSVVVGFSHASGDSEAHWFRRTAQCSGMKPTA